MTTNRARHIDRGVLTSTDSLFDLGRVFVVGDIHGCVDLVLRGMDRVNFDPACDSIVSVGDLIDRGPDSARSIQLLKNDFVYAVRGNHEDMLLGAQIDEDMARNFLQNGGQWWCDTAPSLQADILALVEGLPLVIELESPRGLIGFLHADVPTGMSWQEFILDIKAGDDRTIQTALWGRSRIKQGDDHGVMGVGRVFAGHTPVRPHRLGNFYPVDTGAVFGVLDAADEHLHLTMANVLCHTEILTDRTIKPTPTQSGNLRTIDTEETRPFSPYARVRHR